MREFSALGLGSELLKSGIENRESRFYNRFGQLIYKEPRGKFAGYQYPEVGIHRGRLHMILYKAARDRLGPDSIRTDHECTGVEQDERGATVHFRAGTGGARESVRADVVVDCEGINSAIRKQFYPDDKVAFAGINTWRGITRRKPILDGSTYMRVGSILTGKIVIYPIIDDIDGDGRQLINWMAEIKRDTFEQNDWNKPGRLADFFPLYESWRFDWLDVAQLIRDADQILEYPMVDTGNGNVDLANRSLDFHLEPKLVASAQGQGAQGALAGIGIPFRVTGPWTKLSYAPDMQNVGKAVTSKLLETLTGDKKGGPSGSPQKPAVGDVLKGLFGK